MKTEKLIAGVFAAVLSGITVKVFKTIIDERKKKDEMVIKDER